MGRYGDREKRRNSLPPITPSPYLPIDFSLAGVARITIDIGASFLVTIHAPFHVISVHHLHRPLFHTCEAVTDGTIHPALNVDPVGKDDMPW
jgi:hypothetical protein